MARWPQIDGRARVSPTWASSRATATTTALGVRSARTRASPARERSREVTCIAPERRRRERISKLCTLARKQAEANSPVRQKGVLNDADSR